MWAYSRVDTVRKREHLDLLRAAGIRWLALGIESGKRTIRLEAAKGRFDEVDIHQVVKEIECADINLIGNYLLGLPGQDTASSAEPGGSGGSTIWGGGGNQGGYYVDSGAGQYGSGGGAGIYAGNQRTGKAGGTGIVVIYEYS